jgi:hypothetical protein
MTSQARIEANRRNALRSTGPRTEEGKEKVKFNALKHGNDAQTVVLPHEDAAAYEHRSAAWSRELSPGGKVGSYLAERAARLSWQLDRADAHERAELARRVREVPKERERSRRRRAAELLRKVLAPDALTLVPGAKPGPGRADWIGRLEASAHGCRALLDAWDGVAEKLSAPSTKPGGWAEGVRDSILRLLGVDDRDQAARRGDTRIARIVEILKIAYHISTNAMLRESGLHELADRKTLEPFEDAASRSVLLEIAAVEQERLLGLLEEHEAEVPDRPAEDAAWAAFDRSTESERVHRYQNQWGRALVQTLKAIAALRAALAQSDRDVPLDASRAEVEETCETDGAVAPEQTQRDVSKGQSDNDLHHSGEHRSRPRPAPDFGLRRAQPAARRGSPPCLAPWPECDATMAVASAA